MYPKANPDYLEQIDYVAAFFFVTSMSVYHLYLYYQNRNYPHKSFQSHMTYHRIAWSRRAYDEPKERITIIQNCRSNLMTVGFYANLMLVGSATVAETAFEEHQLPRRLRISLALLLYFIAFINLIFVILAFHYLHFFTMLETTATEALPESDEWNLTNFDQGKLAKMKLHSAALCLDQDVHFRMSWRFMLMAVAATLWVISPLYLIVSSILLIAHFYWTDFPFSAGLNNIFAVETRAQLMSTANEVAASREILRQSAPVIKSRSSDESLDEYLKIQ